jgi:hypothetical protein
MKFLFILCLLLGGCVVNDAIKPKHKPKIQNIETCDAVKLPHYRFPVDIAEYKHKNTTYLIFKCDGMIFVQKVEDSTRAK